MGVSFKVARTGSRYSPCPPPPDPPPADEAGSVPPPAGTEGKVGLLGLGHCLADHSVSSVNCEKNPDGQEEFAASFSLNLFPDGFSIGKPNEGMPLPLVKDLPKVLHPYDRASKSLFSAIENGWLPGEILEDLPCKYINGTVTCEVWDYRSFVAKLVSNDNSDDDFPKVQKVRLQMGMETVVKDMPLISDDAWTYNDLLQAESRIIKALQPVLYLEPKPSLDRLCKTPVLTQLDLGIYGTKVKGKHHIGLESELKCTRQPSRMDIPSNTFSQNLKSQPSDAPKGEKIGPAQCTPGNLPNMGLPKYDNSLGQALPLTSQYGSVINGSFSSPNADMVPSITTAQDEVVKGSCICLKDPADFPVGNSDKLTPGVPCLKPTLKRPKQEPQDFDTYPTISTKKTRLLEPDLQREITALCKRQELQDIHNMLHSTSDNYSHPQVMNEAISGEKMVPDGQTPFPLYKRNAQSSVVKEPIEFETKKIVKAEALKDVEEQTLKIRSSKSYQNLPLASAKAWLPQMSWTNASSTIEKPLRKEIASRKKKSLGTTQVSAGCSLNSQGSQVGEKQMNLIQVSHIMRQNASVIEMSKGNVMSVPAASNGNAFLNPSCNSLIRANQNPPHTKKNSRSNFKNPTLDSSCNGSQGAASQTNIPFCSNSFLVRTPSVHFLSEDESDCAIRRNFSKIEMVVKRHGLNKTKNKNEKFLKTRSLPHSPLGQCCLIRTEDTENFIPFAERKFMSKSILGCSRNTCITRILSYRRVRIFFSGNGIGMPCFLDDCWSKLILSEFDKPDDHKIAAEIIYGDKEERFHLGHLPTTHHADLYASQFTSLMERDEYELVDDQIQFHPSPATPASASNSILLQIGSRGSAELPCDVHFLNHPTETTPFTTKNIPTLKYLGYQSQNVLSPMIPSSCQDLTRPLKREFAQHLESLYMQQSPSQRLLPLLQKNSLDATTIPMVNQPPNSPRLQRLNLQQFQQQQYQQQSIMQQKISVNNLRGHFVASDDHQVPEFCSSNNQQVNRRTSSVQAAVLARLNRSRSMGTGFIAGVPVKGSSGGIVGTRDGSLLSQALDMTSSNHNQSRARRSRNLLSNNYELLHQHQAQAARLQQPEDWQRGQLDLPQQNGSPVGTQMSQATPTSPMQFSSGSVLQQLNAGINIISSPQLSTRTVGSGGSRTSSPMKLQCVGKGTSVGIGNPCKKERNP